VSPKDELCCVVSPKDELRFFKWVQRTSCVVLWVQRTSYVSSSESKGRAVLCCESKGRAAFLQVSSKKESLFEQVQRISWYLIWMISLLLMFNVSGYYIIYFHPSL
jgi:hypothetical protein